MVGSSADEASAIVSAGIPSANQRQSQAANPSGRTLGEYRQRRHDVAKMRLFRGDLH